MSGMVLNCYIDRFLYFYNLGVNNEERDSFPTGISTRTKKKVIN